MSDNKPTPGPWEYDQLSILSRHGNCGHMVRYIADIIDGTDADAALIAAAPDLLAACEAALPWFEDAKGSGKRDGDLLRDAIKNAKAAL